MTTKERKYLVGQHKGRINDIERKFMGEGNPGRSLYNLYKRTLKFIFLILKLWIFQLERCSWYDFYVFNSPFTSWFP